MRSGLVEGFNANGINLRTLTVELLTGEQIHISTDGKTPCSAIWNRVEGELVARGVVHSQIFGLATKTGSDWVFTDPDAKVSKYFPKDWKTSPASSTDESRSLVLYCRVHFYLESIPLNFDEVSLLHYYLQLRSNLISSPRRNSRNLIEALAYALQSEIGDFGPHVPKWVLSLSFYNLISAQLGRAHESLRGLSESGAKVSFIRALTPTYNMHSYGMRLRRKDGKEVEASIGVTPRGIQIYEKNGAGRNEIPEEPKVTFLWANITKLYFERKKFEIRGRACSCSDSAPQKLIFSSWSESVPRHLLLLCRSTHQFHLSNSKQCATYSSSTGSSCSNRGDLSCNSTLSSTSRAEEGVSKVLDFSLWTSGLLIGSNGEESQRVSLISNASSNTTSGVVSDPVYSLDGSEEELETRLTSHSLDSLPPPCAHNLGSKNNCSNNGEDEAKYWYCDSDCEDEFLVNSINNEEGSKNEHFCSCGSCAEDESSLPAHNATPSLASEKTLKAFEFESEKNTQINSSMLEKNSPTPSKHVYGEIVENPENGSEKSEKVNNFRKEDRKIRKCLLENNKHNICRHKKLKNGNIVKCKSKTGNLGLTPKVASLKNLRTQRVSPWALDKNNDKCPNSYSEDYIDYESSDVAQGKYPGTRTVSDNFDTDSDYVQLPPLNPRPPPKKPPPSKLWKFVNYKCSNNMTKSSGNLHLSKKYQCESRLVRKTLEKMSLSKSTTALNFSHDERPPEPPPKPAKLKSGSEIKLNSKAVDAKFITTKPRILVQTAYAAPAAPVPIQSQSQLLFRDKNKLSLSLDNIYDTVACEKEEEIFSPTPPPPLYPKPKTSGVVIRANNYIDIQASSYKQKMLPQKPPLPPPPPYNIQKNKTSGSVPNNLHSFFQGLQNLKPLSRAPIVYPNSTAQNCSLVKNNSNATPKGAPFYKNQNSRSQIQQFKAQLYSDMDYVIFPPKDPRVSQQEYFESKSLSSNLNEIPPPYLPPPPPYPYENSSKFKNESPSGSVLKYKKPPRPLPNTPKTSVSSIYNSNASQCSSYGYYALNSSTNNNKSHHSGLGLNEENLQKFLSTQNMSLNFYSPPTIYYPASTHSAPPLPPTKNLMNSVIIENGMRKAVEKMLGERGLSRSEESLYSQPIEEKLQAIYNLPPPPPYKKKTNIISPSEVDLATLRQKCTALELPLLKALCSEGSLLNQGKLGGKNGEKSSLKNETNDFPPARPPKPTNLRPQPHKTQHSTS